MTITLLRLSFCVTASLKQSSVVQEYQPAVHRLRPSVLGLGPDLPWADEPSPGNLRLSTGMFLACLALLIPAFSLLYRPQLLSVLLLPVQNAPLPITYVIPKLRWCVLAPLHLRRLITRPVSYYALFEWVAASEPTSWLSMQLNILSHLTHTLGP